MMRVSGLCIAGLVALSGSVLAQESAQGDAVNLDEMRERALSLVNDARQQHGLGTLGFSEILDEAAQAHAEDMLNRGYYSHTSPEGETAEDRYRDHGGSRWKLVAENIATCEGCETPPGLERLARFQEGWMKSPGHRENILMEGLESFGFGIAGREGRVYAVQTFAGPGMPIGLSDGEEPVALSADEQIPKALQAVNRARESNGLESLAHSAALTQVASKLLPKNGTGEELIDRPDDLFALLPEEDAMRWRSLQLLAAACGGCGTHPTAADIRYFADQWTGDRREAVLQRAVSHLGFAMQANGEGRKIAVLVLGQSTRD